MHIKYVVFLDGTGGKDTPYDSMLLSFESASFLILEYVFAILCGIVVDTTWGNPISRAEEDQSLHIQ